MIPTRTLTQDDENRRSNKLKSLKSKIRQKDGGVNLLDITFQISRILCYGTTNKIKNCPGKTVKLNPLLNPSVLLEDHQFSGWIFFKFTLLREHESNATKVKLNDNGEYIGSSSVIPFPAPYVNYRGKAIAKIAKSKKSNVDTTGESNFVYKIVRIDDYLIQSQKKLSERMIWFILEEEMRLPKQQIELVLVSCRAFISSGKQTFECYDITKLHNSLNLFHRDVWSKYLSKSPHAISNEIIMPMLWFPLSIEGVNVYDRSSLQCLSKIYRYCIEHPLEIYYEHDTNQKASKLADTNGIIVGPLRKDAFLKSMVNIPELEPLQNKIQFMDQAILEVRLQLDRHTIFYGFQSVDILKALDSLVDVGAILCKERVLVLGSTVGESGTEEKELRKIVYFKLNQYERWTLTILDGFRQVYYRNNGHVQAITKQRPATTYSWMVITPKGTVGSGIPLRKLVSIDTTDLNDEQLIAYNMVVKERKPFVCVTGPPGTGKTRFIQKLHQFYKTNQMDHMIYATTFMNATIVRLNSMGIQGRGTWSVYYAWKSGDHEVLQKLAAIQLLVVEEFSNYSEETASMLMELIVDACPNVNQVLFIFDDQQIRPIDAGNPAINILAALKGKACSVVFHRNHRVLEHDECKVLITNAVRYRDTSFTMGDTYVMDVTKLKTIVDIKKRGCFHIATNITDNLKQLYLMTAVVELLVGFQCIAFKNVRVTELNHILDTVMRLRIKLWFDSYYPEAEFRQMNENVFLLKSPQPISALYLGKRILFTKNVPSNRSINNLTIYRPKLNFASGSASSTIEEVTTTMGEKAIVFSDVTNGEFGIIRSIYRFYIKRQMLIDCRLSKRISNMTTKDVYVHVLELWNPQFNINTGKPPVESELVNILTSIDTDMTQTTSKMVIVHDEEGVPLSTIQTGWAVTVDKYQGAQSKSIVLDFQVKDGTQFTKEHGLVAITRMEDRLILFGNLEELYKMNSSQDSNRTVDLEWRLKELVDNQPVV